MYCTTVSQTPTRARRTRPGGGAGLSCDSPPTMMDRKPVAVSAADHRPELNRLIPTEPLSLNHPSIHCNLKHRSCVTSGGLFGHPEAAGSAPAPARRLQAPGLTGGIQLKEGESLLCTFCFVNSTALSLASCLASVFCPETQLVLIKLVLFYV